MTRQIVWRKPKNPFSASMLGVGLPHEMVVRPGAVIDVKVVTICGRESCSMSVVVREQSTVAQVCRQSEIAASIQHVERRACGTCREMFFREITADEKLWLYANDPNLGRVIGVSGVEGVEGVV